MPQLTDFEPKSAWKISELDEFVENCDRLGGITHPNAVAYCENFSLDLDLNDAQPLDPLSDEYLEYQINLYERIANRRYDPVVGEQTVVPDNIFSANPYGSSDIQFLAKHSRAIITSLVLADLQADSKVLDMGCGWGLSTENFAFNGADVDALDINSNFLDLVNRRAVIRNYSVKTVLSSFEDFDSSESYDLIFFYECLHHAASARDVVKQMSQSASANGSIIFCGEPVTSEWWGPDSWGIRQDALSIYCIRKFGWFETGWSANYIKAVFAHAEWKLWLIPGIGLDLGYIGYALPEERALEENVVKTVSRVIPEAWVSFA